MTDIRCIQIGASTVQGEPIDCKTHEPFRNPIPNAFAGRLVSIRVGDQIVTGKLIPSIRKPDPDDMTRPATRSTKHRREKMTDWDSLMNPAREALEALIAKGDDMADRIEELEAKLEKAEIIIRIIASERLDEAVDLACEYLAEIKGEK